MYFITLLKQKQLMLLPILRQIFQAQVWNKRFAPEVKSRAIKT